MLKHIRIDCFIAAMMNKHTIKSAITVLSSKSRIGSFIFAVTRYDSWTSIVIREYLPHRLPHLKYTFRSIPLWGNIEVVADYTIERMCRYHSQFYLAIIVNGLSPPNNFVKPLSICSLLYSNDAGTKHV